MYIEREQNHFNAFKINSTFPNFFLLADRLGQSLNCTFDGKGQTKQYRFSLSNQINHNLA